MQSLYDKFQSEFTRLIGDERNIALAVSGGGDSMALALLAGKFAKEKNIRVVAITVDHRLRSESAEEAKSVGKWLAGYGIEHHILNWSSGKVSSNIQAKARNARYKLMSDFCADNHIKTIAVAHTVNDQAETVLMRLLRGSGVDGLSGIADVSDVFGLRVIRPLLKVPGEELRKYLGYTAQKWVEDPSNNNIKFERVRIRHFINSSARPVELTTRLAKTSWHIRRAKDYIDEQVKKNIKGVVTFHPQGFYTINMPAFRLLHEEERLRSLAAALQHIGGNHYKPRFSKLSALENNIINGNMGGGCTLWGCAITPSKKASEEGLLFLFRELSAVSKDIKLNVKCSNPLLKSSGVINYTKDTAVPDGTYNVKIEWDGRFICTVGDISLKNLAVGALGIEGYEYISKHGFEYNHDNDTCFKIPKKMIYPLPALKKAGKVLAVPDIGYYANGVQADIFLCEAKPSHNIFSTF